MDYSNMQVLRSGPANGLSLIIFLDNSEYLKGLTSGTGGHIVIHKSNTFAFPDTDGLALAAGMEVNIALRMTRISRLGRPYGDCEDGYDFHSSFQHIYSRRTCQHFCEHSLIATTCGCYDNENEETQLIMQKLTSEINKTHRPCDTVKDFQCMAEVERKYLTREMDCGCKNPCL
ncbi:amiloride-sensitive sodium channel subunit gamma [Plakobranchus ocellatus]|uniref:Amiloride-sensitive sodium channel subunit gamma n=1 Tax=Plakobranchus ocellatus TaxID=259542 RepID=A0AAV3YST3_9GAST|nr:amiloride-sensitive sodium channel subunit gamma [Plakobranchus ocellatus]